MAVIRKSPQEIDAMAAAGAVLVETMDLLAAEIRPGISTRELDEIAERHIRSRGCEPSFKGYRGFPGSICASPNAMVVHGIPGSYRLIQGDILSVDIGVTRDGWVADAARTFPVGSVSREAEKLLSVTEEALLLAVGACRPGNHLGDIGFAVQRHVEANGFSVIRTLVGHGVGHSMHEDPQVPNYGREGSGMRLEAGMVLAIEPMVNVGKHTVRMANDGWSIFSQDGSLAAHFEFTVAITPQGPRVLTPWHESAGRPAA